MTLRTDRCRPNLGRGRKIGPGQTVHVSVLFKPHYRPKASLHPKAPAIYRLNPLPEPLRWDDPLTHRAIWDLDDLWEKDLFDPSTIPGLFTRLSQGELSAMDQIEYLSFSGTYHR